MEKIEFKVINRNQNRMSTTIHAKTKSPIGDMTLHLDNNTGDIFYPVLITSGVLGISITLDSDTNSSCSFPPSIPENMVDNFTSYLGTFHDVVAAARKFISKEQQMIKDTKFTFMDLYSAIDFRNCCLLHIEGSDWEVEINKFTGKNIKLYKRDTKYGNFFRKLIIGFDDDTIELRPIKGDYEEGRKIIRNETLIMDSVWFHSLFSDQKLGEECSEFLIAFTRNLKDNR